MNNTTPDPISTQERVLVRSTATGFEQGIAALAGLLTAGPMGALAAWGALRGLQGKWAPWFILGVPAAVVINVVQLTLLILITGATMDLEDNKQYDEIDYRTSDIIHTSYTK